MKNYFPDTIVAPATPPGRGGVAIIRVSGNNVKTIANQLIGKVSSPRLATYVDIKDSDGQVLDQGISLFFPAPHSFTGEDVLELHCHGGPAIINDIVTHVMKQGARFAKPGEFSERAFLNDKIDLVQAEAIADLIDASSSQAARSALRSLQGEFSKKINELVDKIIHLRMYVEAAIDFVEEEVDFLADTQIYNDLTTILTELEFILSSAKQGHLLRDGITAVIAGKPNAGKSSLLNQLSGRDIAIVTDIAGTTRDVLREYITIDGMPIHMIDTAGLHESKDIVEQEGIRRAKSEIMQADIILFVIDASEKNPPVLKDFLDIIPANAKIITIRNKIDLLGENPTMDHSVISLSAKHGDGISLLKDFIKSEVGYQSISESIFSARKRHLDALTQAKKYLLEGKHELENHKAGELLAENLRLTQQALIEITGEFTTEDLLGRIFSSFCIGK